MAQDDRPAGHPPQTTEHEAVRHLMRLCDVGPPDGPSGVDLTRAIRSGRRRARARRAAGPAAAAAGLVAVVLLALTMTGPPGKHSTGPADRDRTSFDVRERAFRVGSAGGFTPDVYETGRRRQRIVLRPDEPDRKPSTSPKADRPAGTGRTPRAIVTMYAEGAWRPPDGTAAEPVDGHPARWIGDAALAWQWRPGAWGTVTTTGGERVIAHRVAQSVQPAPAGRAQRVEVPVTAPAAALGPYRRLAGTVSSLGDERFGHLLALRYTGSGPDWIEIGIQRPLPGRDTPRNTTANGRPATRHGETVELLDDTGRYAQAGSPQALSALGGTGALRGLAGSIRVRDGFAWPSPAPSHGPAGTGPPG